MRNEVYLVNRYNDLNALHFGKLTLLFLYLADVYKKKYIYA